MTTSPVGGIDPHQSTFTLGIVDPVGVAIAHASFDNTATGYLAAIDMLQLHRVELVGVEGSASWGAHVSIALVAAGFDAREVPPQRSAGQRRVRRLDKTDTVDAISTARALLAEPTLGTVQTLEVYDALVAKIEAVLEHRRMLVEVRTHAGPSPRTEPNLKAAHRHPRPALSDRQDRKPAPPSRRH